MTSKQQKKLIDLLIEWGKGLTENRDLITMEKETGIIHSDFLDYLNQKTPLELGYVLAGLSNAMGLMNQINPTDRGALRTAYQAARTLNNWWIMGATMYLQDDTLGGTEINNKMSPQDLLGMIIESAVKLPTANEFERQAAKNNVEALFKEYDSDIIN